MHRSLIFIYKVNISQNKVSRILWLKINAAICLVVNLFDKSKAMKYLGVEMYNYHHISKH